MGYIFETIRCGKSIRGRVIVGECGCVTSGSDIDLTFDLAVVTLTIKLLFGLYLRNCKVQEVDTWQGY